jgi:hypothetical protein
MNEGSTNYAKNKELLLIRRIFNFFSLFNGKLSITNRADNELQGNSDIPKTSDIFSKLLQLLIFLKNL